MRRSIPDSYHGTPLFPRLLSLTDADGNPRPSETDSDDGVYSMTSRASSFVHGPQTYVFTYELRNVVRAFDDTDADEFYWNVNGLDWRQPFGRVTARVNIPADLASELTGGAFCYRGSAGSAEQCEMVRDAATGGDAVFEASALALGPHQTMTIAIGFEPGTFTAFDSSPLATGWGWAQLVAALGSLGALVLGVVTRARKLRDAPGRPTIIAEYDPPRGLDALQGAVLLGKLNKAIPAEVLEQAVTGSIRLVEGEKRWFGTKLIAQLVDPTLADENGYRVLQGLFGPAMSPGDEYEFGRSDTRFSSVARKLLTSTRKDLERRGLRRKVAPGVRAWPIAIAVAAALLVVLFGILSEEVGVSTGIVVGLIMFGIAVVVVVALCVSRHPFSAEGAEARDHLVGLRMFIEWAEADRIRMLQSPAGAERRPIDTSDPRQMLHLYETLLPYAVVFGQEKKWANQLAVYYRDDSPTWYVGSSGFNIAAFTAGISSLSASTAASSSTSGGSSGGGSAGGGGGGGGGGGV